MTGFTLLTHATTPRTAREPFRRTCGQGHEYSAPSGHPEPAVLAAWMDAHGGHEDGKHA